MPKNLDSTKLPQHVGIIMDGNGRWAKSNHRPRIEGHRKGADVVEDITEAARELGIPYLTLYAFSKENWQRPADETQALMALLVEFLTHKKEKMQKNGIALHAIGDLTQLPEFVRTLLFDTIEATRRGKNMTLTLALSYGARDEILRAVKILAADLSVGSLQPQNLTEQQISGYLDTKNIPDPDLIIRTSGEMRISNFLLWQAAYAEFAFVKEYWPDFTRDTLMKCLTDYAKRERRFGMTSEQLD